MRKFDIIIVGAGISGSVLAERFANKKNKRVLLIEKRDHIGGNCYDFHNGANILVPKYGPHFFHTNSREVWKYINKFSEWKPYEHRVLSFVEGKFVPVPVNIQTVNVLFNEQIKTPVQMKRWLKKNTVQVKNPKNSEELALKRVGKMLYEKLFKGYTIKQWGKDPRELDPGIIGRIPVRTDFDDRYFDDVFQAMPKFGYERFFKKITQNPNITIKLSTDYFQIADDFNDYEMLFFTGPIDSFFKYEFGPLEYRSLRFVHKTHNREFIQKRTQINYPNEKTYTRITEPKHSTGQKNSKTTLIKEYPRQTGEPYYPMLNKHNKLIYQKYLTLAKKFEKNRIFFIGRLAQYSYLNMDQAFQNALYLFKSLT